MDHRLGPKDLIVWTKEEDGNIPIGKIEKVSSTNYKPRIGDGQQHDLCGDPIYLWVFPKLYPNEDLRQARPSEVKLSNRNMRVGVMVKKDRQIGFVQDIIHKVSIKFLNYDLFYYDVPMRQLQDPWNSCVLPKRPIFYKGWVGRLGPTIRRKVFLKWEDIFIAHIDWNELAMLFLQENLVKTAETSFEVNGFCFYPGRKFCVAEKCIYGKTVEGIVDWVGSPPELNPSRESVTLEILQTELQPFQVRWLRKVGPGENTEPPKELRAEDLEHITWIRPFHYIALGDVRMFQVRPEHWPELLNRVHWNSLLKRKYSPLSPKQQQFIGSSLPPITFPEDECRPLALDVIPVEVVHVTSEVEIGWIDGSRSRHDSRDVVRIRNTRLPIGTFVQEKGADVGSSRNKYGVIQRVNIAALKDGSDTAVVKWITRTNQADFAGQNLVKIEEINLRLIEAHPEYNFSSDTKQNVIVTSSESARHAFGVGYVINTFADGKVRVRAVDGKIYVLWPDEVSRITPSN